ncbi:MAG: hypothetical protein STSR0009_16290 [Methanoregula sp.]
MQTGMRSCFRNQIIVGECLQPEKTWFAAPPLPVWVAPTFVWGREKGGILRNGVWEATHQDPGDFSPVNDRTTPRHILFRGVSYDE